MLFGLFFLAYQVPMNYNYFNGLSLQNRQLS